MFVAVLRTLGDFDADGLDDIAFGAEAEDAINGTVRFGSTGVIRGSALPH